MNPERGMTLGSRYTLTNRIAAGGMGDVWRATDSILGREVAVKVMRPDASAEPTFAERFRDEARHTAALSHQNIATVYDYGEDDGAAYLVMELVDGEPLSAMIARGPLPPDRVRSITGQAALALAAAHAAGVVHRDVKPANIMVTPDGRVKLTDFGIARAVDGASHTRTGEVLGTPQYLSPEQALGRVATGASDLYALGIITQEMLTGRKPFDSGSAVATALAQVNEAPPPLTGVVPLDLRRMVEQSLAKDPDARPTSAAAVAAALGMPVSGLAHVSPATSVVHTGDTDPAGTQVIPEAVPNAGPTSVIPPANTTDSRTHDDRAGYDTGFEDGVPQQDSPYAPAYSNEYPAAYAAAPEPARRAIGLWWLPILVLLAALAFFAFTYLSNSGAPAPVVTVTTTATLPSTATSVPPTTITPTQTTAPPSQTTAPTTTTTAPPSETTAPTTTTTASSSTTQAPATVDLKKNDFVGKSEAEAKAALSALGFTDIRTTSAPGKEPAGMVTAISPSGKVAVGSRITLTLSDGNATAGPGKTTKGGDVTAD